MDDSLIFEAAVLGQIEVRASEVQSLQTDAEVEAHLSDGSVRRDRLAAASDLSEIAKINPEPIRWHGDLAAGLAVSRGNTDSQDANADFQANRRTDDSRIDLKLGYEGSRQQTTDGRGAETSKRRYYGGARYDRFLNARYFWYVGTHAERDGVADLDLRLTTGPGLGWQIVERTDRSFALRAGLSWVRERYGDNRLDTDYLSFEAGWDWLQAFGPGVELFHNGRWIPSLREIGDNQLLHSETGLRAR